MKPGNGKEVGNPSSGQQVPLLRGDGPLLPDHQRSDQRCIAWGETCVDEATDGCPLFSHGRQEAGAGGAEGDDIPGVGNRRGDEDPPEGEVAGIIELPRSPEGPRSAQAGGKTDPLPETNFRRRFFDIQSETPSHRGEDSPGPRFSSSQVDGGARRRAGGYRQDPALDRDRVGADECPDVTGVRRGRYPQLVSGEAQGGEKRGQE